MVVRLVFGKPFRLRLGEDLRVLTVLLWYNLLERPFGLVLIGLLCELRGVGVPGCAP